MPTRASPLRYHREMRLVSALSAALLASILMTANATAAAPQKIVMGQVGLSFYAVTGGVIKRVLEALGHPVEIVEGPHEKIYPELGAGKVDIFTATWLPYAHAVYWAQYQDSAVELTTLYEGGQFCWCVPDYVPQALVASVADLGNSQVLERMDKTIRGTGPGSGLMIQSAKMMTEYGLEQAGYRLQPGAPKDWIENFERAVTERRWLVMPLWQPQFLNKAYRVRALAEPKGLLGGPNRAVLVAHKSFPERFPTRTVQALKRVQLGMQAVTDMDYMMNVDKKSAQEAADAWLSANPDFMPRVLM